MNPIRLTISLLVASFAAVLTSSPTHAETITEAMQKRLPQVVNYLNDNRLKNVGVLKFEVHKSGSSRSDSVGPINSLLADRLEVGLILANPFEERQLNIIENASVHVSRIKGVSHKDAAGRSAMFSRQYPLAWGGQTVDADAFLIGIVVLDEETANGEKQLKATVSIYSLKRGSSELTAACPAFTADVDAETFTESGGSFLLRGIFDKGRTKLTGPERESEVRKQFVKVKKQTAPFPAVDKNAPVKLEIRYDDRPVRITTKDGEAFIPEPGEGQKIEIVINLNTTVKGRLGVVLRVNGENTLYRSTVRDLEAPKWILSPDHSRTTIRGYQIAGENKLEKFKVLSDAESDRRAVNYGRYVGQIQLTVFQEQTTEPEPKLVDMEGQVLAAMLHGVQPNDQPNDQPNNLSALKTQLLSGGSLQLRGLIANDDKAEENKVKTVNFVPESVPVMSTTIRYRDN